ncbi:DNA-binding protein [Rhodococcus pyridinivorans]|uniref:helix-turn-helix transcriptional regulator n=1 Tax=Rhodococcus pyridinivorans TaxID=103816 RepID=UPI0034359BBD
MSTEPRPLATPQEVAEYRRVSTEALAQERRRGTGPRFSKLGRQVRYDWQDVLDWVAAHTVTAGAEERS